MAFCAWTLASFFPDKRNPKIQFFIFINYVFCFFFSLNQRTIHTCLNTTTNQPIITKQQHCNCAFSPNWLPTPPTAALLIHVACGSLRRAQVAWHYHTLIHALATAATVSASAPAATTAAADPAGALGSSSLAPGKRKEQCRVKGRRERFDSLLSHFSYIYYAPHSYLFPMLCKLNFRLESPLIVTIMQKTCL